jgi:hypothetical protein
VIVRKFHNELKEKKRKQLQRVQQISQAMRNKLELDEKKGEASDHNGRFEQFSELFPPRFSLS